MSRVIKFRMWNDQAEKFHYGFEAFECLKQQSCEVYDHVGINNAAFEQFTGLLDKNDTEIYEGDIVHWPHMTRGIEGNLVVIFSASDLAFVADKQDGSPDSWLDSKCEVIGNIHQNPKLLTTPQPTV